MNPEQGSVEIFIRIGTLQSRRKKETIECLLLTLCILILPWNMVPVPHLPVLGSWVPAVTEVFMCGQELGPAALLVVALPGALPGACGSGLH